MKNIFLLCAIAVTAVSSQLVLKKDSFSMPAEWEPHEAVWIGWELFEPYYQPTKDVIKALTPTTTVKIVAENDSTLTHAKDYLIRHGVDTARLQFYVMKDNRLWMRDHGAAFLLNKKGELAAADFSWSLYGFKDWVLWRLNGDKDSTERVYRRRIGKTGLVDSLMGLQTKAKNVATNIVIEGGSIEVNGKGTLILNETVTMQRNPGVRKEVLEQEFKRVLGVRKIIWVKQGLADDPHIARQITENYVGFGTGGHTDEFVRFADARTILLAWVDEHEKERHPISRLNYERMQENLRILENATDQDGKPFRIVKVPLPDPITKSIVLKNEVSDTDYDNLALRWFGPPGSFKDGEQVNRVAAASYLNYLVTNDVVLLPTYTPFGSSGAKEEQVRKIFGEMFPGRRLIFLNVLNLNFEGGGIHCITQQQPKRRGAK